MKRFAFLIVIIAVTTTLTVGMTKFIDSKSEIEKLKIHSTDLAKTQDFALNMQQKSNDMTLKALESQSSFYRALSKQDYKDLKISNVEYTPAEVGNIVKTTRERKPITQVLYTGKYVITDIHFEEEATLLDVHSEDGKQVIKSVNIFKDYLSQDDYKWLKDSANREPVFMRINATEKNGEIIASSLINFEK